MKAENAVYVSNVVTNSKLVLKEKNKVKTGFCVFERNFFNDQKANFVTFAVVVELNSHSHTSYCKELIWLVRSSVIIGKWLWSHMVWSKRRASEV